MDRILMYKDKLDEATLQRFISLLYTNPNDIIKMNPDFIITNIPDIMLMYIKDLKFIYPNLMEITQNCMKKAIEKRLLTNKQPI